MELGFPINIEKSAALYIHPSAPIRKVTPSTSTPPVLLNLSPDKDGHRNACSWRDRGQRTFLVTSCWVSHLQILSEDRHPPEKQTPANTFCSPTVLPGNHSTGPRIRCGVNCPIHVCKSQGSPLLCLEKGGTLHCWSGLASRWCPKIEKSSPYPYSGLEKSAAIRPFATKKSRLASEKILLVDKLANESCRLADRLATKLLSKRTTPMRTKRDHARCVAVFVGPRWKGVGRSGPVDRVCE